MDLQSRTLALRLTLLIGLLANSFPAAIGGDDCQVFNWDACDAVMKELRELESSTNPDDLARIECIEAGISKLTLHEDDGHVISLSERRTRKARLVLQFYKTVMKRIDPHFDPNDVNAMPTLNVVPPVESFAPAGASPDVIVNPELRRQYIQAIEENHAKAKRYTFQSALYVKHKIWLRNGLFLISRGHFADDSQEFERIAASVFADENLLRQCETELNTLDETYWVDPTNGVLRRPTNGGRSARKD